MNRQRMKRLAFSCRLFGRAHRLDPAEQGVVFLAGADRDSQLVRQWGSVEMTNENPLSLQAIVHLLALAVRNFRQEEICVTGDDLPAERFELARHSRAFAANMFPGHGGV